MIRTITTAMQRKRITRSQLAKDAGLSLSYIHDICSGNKRLSTRAAIKIGNALSISPRALLVAQVDEDLAAARAEQQEEASK